MLIYIFKDGKDKRYVASEHEAHQKLRTLSNWERQDLKYMGACEDTISKNAQQRRQIALRKVIEESPEYKTVELQLKVATLEENNKDIPLLTSKKELMEMSIEASINKLGNPDSMPTAKDDLLRGKYLKYINDLETEEINNLNPDPKIFPRDFSRIEHRFGGKEAGATE